MAPARAVHLDASRPGQPLRTALCGYLGVTTETDLTRVTCTLCRRALAGRAKPGAPRKGSTGAPTQAEMAAGLAEALRPMGVPQAGPPPRLTAPMWSSSCKGGEYRRCGSCALCEWEREAERWAAKEVSAHNEHGPRVARLPRKTVWSSLAEALRALADWESHGRVAPSAMGGILARIKSGEIGGTKESKGDDPLLNRAGDLVRVRRALETAYPDNAHAVPQARRMRLLLERTPGVLLVVRPYEELAAEVGVDVGEVQALVKSGRKVVTVELAARGLIPPPARASGLTEAVYERAQEIAEDREKVA